MKLINLSTRIEYCLGVFIVILVVLFIANNMTPSGYASTYDLENNCIQLAKESLKEGLNIDAACGWPYYSNWVEKTANMEILCENHGGYVVEREDFYKEHCEYPPQLRG